MIKKKILLSLTIIMTVLFCVSCADNRASQTKQTMDSWLGATKADLLLKWGPPSSTFPDGKGGEIYSYIHSYQTSGSYKYNDFYDIIIYRPPKEHQSIYRFYINSQDVIYNYYYEY